MLALALVVILAVGFTSGIYLEDRLADWIESTVEAELQRAARAGRDLIELSDESLSIVTMDPIADRLGESLAARVTIIDERGVVLGDSELSSAGVGTIQNHGSRPEVRAARESGIGVAHRYSATMHVPMLYVAVPFERSDGGGTIRVARPLEIVEEAIGYVRLSLLVAGLIGLGVAIMVLLGASYLMSRAFDAVIERARAAATAQSGLPRESDGRQRHQVRGITGMADELDRMVEVLVEERDRFEIILDGMGDAVLALDSEQRVTLANSASLELLELDRSPVGQTLLETVRAPELVDLVDAVHTGDEEVEEFELPGHQGRRVFAWCTPLRAAEGTVIVMHDVTEMRRLESVRRDFVANVSHELRTPVTVIRANAETLLDGALEEPDQARQFTSGILRNAERLSRLVSDLLDLSRIESRQWKFESVPITVKDAVERAMDAVLTTAAQKKLELAVDLDIELQVLADEKALDEVLVNLLDNAVKYAAPQGLVEVSARSLGKDVRVEVRDDGPGIEERHRERLFERFYRVDTGRSREMGGTGLGLAIVKHLVEAMGGAVGFEPSPTGGSVFWLSLKSGG